jgi:hypothetical protein
VYAGRVALGQSKKAPVADTPDCGCRQPQSGVRHKGSSLPHLLQNVPTGQVPIAQEFRPVLPAYLFMAG